MDKQKENGAVLIAASIVAAIRLRARGDQAESKLNAVVHDSILLARTILAQIERQQRDGSNISVARAKNTKGLDFLNRAFTPAGLINNSRHDFGSIIRFIAHNFGIAEGALTFADSRGKTGPTGFFPLTTARQFVTIPGGQSAATFLAEPVAGPDDDDD